MSKRKDEEYLKDILMACQNIMSYVEGYDFDMFLDDRKTQDAVVRNLEIIGEAVKGLSEDIKEKYSQIEWNDIARTRDKLIHSYFGIDIDIVWDIISIDIPELEKHIADILHKENFE